MTKNVIFIIIAALGLVSCGQKTQEVAGKKGSSGKTCEMMVVADRDVYRGATKELITRLFASPQEGLLRGDPMFDLVNIPTSSFQNTEMFRVHRNVLVCNVKEGNPDKVLRAIDNYSAPQVVYEVVASSRAKLDSLLEVVAPRMIADMRHAEHQRIIKAFYGTRNVNLMQLIERQYGFKLTVSEEFEVAKMEPDFGWVRKEAKDFSLHVLMFSEDYTDKHQFDSVRIMNRIDTVMKHYVPSAAEGSWTGLERKNWAIGQQRVTLAGETAVELRGMWRSFGDFMGGPFVSYTLATPDHKRLLTLVGFCYCPRSTTSMPYPMRDLLMQVESICWSLCF